MDATFINCPPFERDVEPARTENSLGLGLRLLLKLDYNMKVLNVIYANPTTLTNQRNGQQIE